jgi:hypothetical protein
MSQLFRPSILILLSVALALGAAFLVLWDRPSDAAPLPLGENDQEIVWLYPATSAANWERFVTAVNTAAGQLRTKYPKLEVQITDRTFPPQTTAVPELALAVRGRSGRLVFRWYKVTSDQKTEYWTSRLAAGPRRPPLAVIGGASSDQAIDLAHSLNKVAEQSAAPPLLILTTATADRVPPPPSAPDRDLDEGQGELINHIYRGRTCRFCFTNRQMAEAVSRFIWGRDELRPDADPVYMVMWEDDAYSRDLIGSFSGLLCQPAVEVVPHEWACLAAGGGAGGSPLTVASALAGPWLGEVRFLPRWIDYSIGTFDQPNRWETAAASLLMEARLREPPAERRSRPLLVLPAAAQGPARRFLRGLMRASPAEARRFVVATGDGLAFNTVYRDRNVSWPIQDLPFDLVFFCHRNPVDAEAGFRPDNGPRADPPGPGSSSTGTEDLLLYMDIVKALVHAAHQGNDLPRSGDELRRRLAEARWKDGGVSFDPDGQPLFDADGHRRTGTGEHIVWLFPIIEGEQVRPKAIIRVWSWPIRGKEEDFPPLTVEYGAGAEGS